MTTQQVQTISPERALIGALLAGARIPLDDLGITSGDFADPAMGTVWETIERHGRDPLTVQRALADTPLRNQPTIVTDLVGEACAPGSVEYYAGIIAADADRRGLVNAGLRIQQLGTLDRDPEELIEEARTMLDKAPRRLNWDTPSMADVIADALDAAEHPDQGLPWPWHDVNNLMIPLMADRLYVIGARPAVGKSLVGQAIAVDVARRGRPVAFASLEMSYRQLGQRMIASTATIELGHLVRGSMTDGDWNRSATASKNLIGLPILIDDTPGQTIAHIRRHARDVKRRCGDLGVVIVDYLQLVRPRDARVRREEQVSEMSRSLKLLSRELHVPVVALAQLNRAAAGKDATPTMANLRESGAIEQDADVVVLLHRDDDEFPGQIEWIAEKQRDGQKGRESLMVAGHHARIE